MITAKQLFIHTEGWIWIYTPTWPEAQEPASRSQLTEVPGHPNATGLKISFYVPAMNCSFNRNTDHRKAELKQESGAKNLISGCEPGRQKTKPSPRPLSKSCHLSAPAFLSCSIPEGAQGHVGWSPGQPDLVLDLVVGNPAHSRGIRTG